MKILTGNDLVSGDVIWWAGDGWSRQVGDSIDVGQTGEDLARTEEAALRVVGAYVIDATITDEGVRPRISRTAFARSAPRCDPT